MALRNVHHIVYQSLNIHPYALSLLLVRTVVLPVEQFVTGDWVGLLLKGAGHFAVRGRIHVLVPVHVTRVSHNAVLRLLYLPDIVCDLLTDFVVNTLLCVLHINHTLAHVHLKRLWWFVRVNVEGLCVQLHTALWPVIDKLYCGVNIGTAAKQVFCHRGKLSRGTIGLAVNVVVLAWNVSLVSGNTMCGCELVSHGTLLAVQQEVLALVCSFSIVASQLTGSAAVRL
mmetsp:Transcript_30844/g.37381  ORF Transcript_30844/g.37381 Transcript_30844/m.37381 type:complete len:227 (-) Transcript_30844:626-1306(-)